MTARACLEALGQRGRPEAEGLLLEALRSEDAPVSVAAAQALGRAGTVTAVAPLREAAERSADLRRAARQAIAEIQARLAGAEPGQLSLADGEAGALSLADGEPGRLSLADEAVVPRDSRACHSEGLRGDGSRGIRSLSAGAGGFLVARRDEAPRNDSGRRGARQIRT